MIQCNRCNLQYKRETKRRLKDRFNEHRFTTDTLTTNPNLLQPQNISCPLLSNHTANGMQLTPSKKSFRTETLSVRLGKLFYFKKAEQLILIV